jgi:outer membrane protein
MFQRLALFLALLFAAAPAVAADSGPRVAVVDFQKAIDSVADGEAARKKMDAAMKEKQASIKTLETQLKAMKDEYDKQSLILSDAARKQKEQEFMNAQMQYQQTAQQAEAEMQQLYVQLMESLISKMRAIAGEIGKEKGYDLILETGAGVVVYWVPTLDITQDLITRYNAKNPSTAGGK